MHDNNINIGSLLRNIMRPVRLVNITSFIGIPEPDFLLNIPLKCGSDEEGLFTLLFVIKRFGSNFDGYGVIWVRFQFFILNPKPDN